MVITVKNFSLLNYSYNILKTRDCKTLGRAWKTMQLLLLARRMTLMSVCHPPHKFLSKEDINQCVSLIWHWLSTLVVGILLQKASGAALPSTGTQRAPRRLCVSCQWRDNWALPALWQHLTFPLRLGNPLLVIQYKYRRIFFTIFLFPWKTLLLLEKKFFRRMVQWFREGAWGSLKLFVVIHFLQQLVYKISALFTKTAPPQVLARSYFFHWNLVLLLSFSLGIWWKARYEVTCCNYMSAIKPELKNSKTVSSIPSQAPSSSVFIS